MMIRRILSGWVAAGLVTTAFAGEVRFTGDGHAENPVWSLDGRYLAFEANNLSDRTDMHISMVTGEIAKDAKKVNLPSGGGPFAGSQVVINPAWHPQGLVVFEGSNPGGTFRLYYYQPGGGAASEMIRTQDVPGDLTFPAINEDGSSLVFSGDNTGKGDLNLRNTNTGKVDIILKTESPEMFPQFAKDGSKILYTRKHNNAHDVFELDLNTGGETPIAGGSNDQTRPNYVSGGVVFFDNSRESTAWDVKVRAGGSTKTLAKDVRLPQRARPAVTPDKQWVAYALQETTRASSVMVTKVDGSKTVEIKTPHTACGEPAITMQGGKMLLAYTALPQSGVEFRRLYVIDITGKL